MTGSNTPDDSGASGATRGGEPKHLANETLAKSVDGSTDESTIGEPSPSRLFILRPIATSLLMLAVLLAGFVGYRLLPQSALPEVDYPTIQISTLYPGASPDVITSSITSPLERQFGQMPGLSQMWSSSSGGASVINLRFDLNLPLDVAEQEVQAAINAATTSFLPDGR